MFGFGGDPCIVLKDTELNYSQIYPVTSYTYTNKSQISYCLRLADPPVGFHICQKPARGTNLHASMFFWT